MKKLLLISLILVGCSKRTVISTTNYSEEPSTAMNCVKVHVNGMYRCENDEAICYINFLLMLYSATLKMPGHMKGLNNA